MEKQKHPFRTWKSGKIWLFSSGILLIFVIGSIGLTAQADEVTSNTETTTQSSDVTTQSSPVSPTVNSSLAASDSTTEELAVVSNMENTAQASSYTNILTTESSTVDTNLATQSNQSSIAISLTKASSESSINEPASTIANETTTTADVTTQTTATQAQTNNPTTSLSSESQGKPTNPSQSKSPEITNIQVTGAVDNNATGSAVFDGVNITLQGKDITDDNLLDPSGLHWSDQTQVIAIKGTATGQLNQENFGVQDGPIIPATTYTMNDGDSGRITYVGKTLSGLDLDMIYTVASSDKDNWQANEGSDDIPQGLAFTGEQNIADSGGNSIVCLYNGANSLSLIYQIVKHDTTIEVPVVASFITADIDVAQGVQTNLANLVTILPQTTNLKQDGDTIYDASPNYPGLDGVASLPYGGYLGAGFVSEFYYNYYAPAPERADDSYFFAQGVRYDLFGSALQAHMNTQIRQNFTVNYLDEFGHKIQETDHYLGFTGQDYNLPIPTIPHYGFVNMTENDSVKNNPVINLIYNPNYYKTINNYYGTSDNNFYYQGTIYTPEISVSYPNSGQASINVAYQSKDYTYSIPVVNEPTFAYTTMGYVPKGNPNYFSQNTGINGVNQDNFYKFIDYIAKTTQGGMSDVNHAIANAISYNPYIGTTEKFINNFGADPNALLNRYNLGDLFGKKAGQHNNTQAPVDLAHVMTAIAAYEQEGGIQGHAGNLMVGNSVNTSLSNFLTGYNIPVKDVELMTNTFVGDSATVVNQADLNADADAWILTHLPPFDKLPLNQAIEEYYSIPNLAQARVGFFRQSISKYGGTGEELAILLSLSMGSAAAIYLGRKKAGAKKTADNLFKVAGGAGGTPVKADTVTVPNASVTHPVKSTSGISTLLKEARTTFTTSVHRVAETFNAFKNRVVKASQNIKTFINNGVKAAKSTLNQIVQIAKQKAAVALQAARQVVQQAQNVYHGVSNFVTSAYNNYIAPVVNRVVQVTTGVYNNYIKPVINTVVHVVQNTYHAVTSWVSSTYKSVTNWVSNKAKSVVNWFKNLW